MPQSLVKNSLHITFSTKDRYPFINNNIENELFCYLGGICKRLDCNPIIVGGYKDHVHILCQFSRKLALMKLIEELKSHSSKWIKVTGKSYAKFYWQRGYGAFSVNPTEIEIVKQYISHQHQHHQTKSFKNELRAFLNKYHMEFDERYVWD